MPNERAAASTQDAAAPTSGAVATTSDPATQIESPGASAPRPRRRWARWFGLGALLVTLLAMAGLFVFLQPQPLLPEATAALAGDGVNVDDAGDWLAFMPTGSASATGLIVYPGGKAPAAAYAPAARAIADAGYPVFITEPPLNLAVLDGGAAADIMAAHPEVERWVVAGHSLGGVAAASFAADHVGPVAGLVLWASYPAGDLSNADLVTSSIAGTLDAGADRMIGPEAADPLPTGATVVPIEGGNHEQIGWYTGQPGDPPATITREAQQAALVAATLDVLARVDGPGAGN